MTTLPRLAARAFNTPLWVESRFADVVASVLGPRIGFTVNVLNAAPDESKIQAEPARSPLMTDTGIMVLPVVGGLAHRGDWIDAECGGLQSYTNLQNHMVAGLDDPEVRAILLDIDSPGGEAGGCFEFGDFVRDARSRKPIYAVANARACSAAYLIGSSASKFFCTPSGEVGSIGVCWLHADFSGALEKAGVVTTWLYAGEHKVDGNPYERLSKAARADIQKSIDESYALFVAQVAANRPMSPEAIRDTKARTFGAAEAAELDLVDGVLSFQGALDALEADLKQARAPGVTLKEGESMSTPAPTNTPAPTAADNSSALEAARAEGHAAGYAAGRADAGKIVSSEEAKGRASLAAQFAADPAIKPDAALGYLKASPVAASKESAASRFDAAMAREGARVENEAGGDVDERAARQTQIKAAAKAASAARYGR